MTNRIFPRHGPMRPRTPAPPPRDPSQRALDGGALTTIPTHSLDRLRYAQQLATQVLRSKGLA